MATVRDYDQMLKVGLEMKESAQKIIDFCKMNGAGEGGEGEEDLKSVDEEEENDTNDTEESSGPVRLNGKNSAILVALRKKMGK